LGIK